MMNEFSFNDLTSLDETTLNGMTSTFDDDIMSLLNDPDLTFLISNSDDTFGNGFERYNATSERHNSTSTWSSVSDTKSPMTLYDADSPSTW